MASGESEGKMQRGTTAGHMGRWGFEGREGTAEGRGDGKSNKGDFCETCGNAEIHSGELETRAACGP